MTNCSHLSSSIRRQRTGSWALPSLISRFRQKGKKGLYLALSWFSIVEKKKKTVKVKMGFQERKWQSLVTNGKGCLEVGQLKTGQLKKHSHTGTSWSDPWSRDSMEETRTFKRPV